LPSCSASSREALGFVGSLPTALVGLWVAGIVMGFAGRGVMVNIASQFGQIWAEGLGHYAANAGSSDWRNPWPAKSRCKAYG
jgi:glycerol uptake facilitator-like aquaporin